MKLNISLKGVIFYFLTAQTISAQDIHLSQYHFDRLQINPALTGMFNGDWQAAVIHKQQWFSVPGVDYLTFSGSFDAKLKKIQDPKGFFSIGGLFNYDEAGDSELSLGSLSLNGSYTRRLDDWIYVGLGAYVGGGQRKFEPKALKWGLQWNGEVYDPNLPSQESFDETSFFFMDLGAGANIRLQGKERTKLDLGVGAFHLNEPSNSFYTNSSMTLPTRLSFSALGVLKLVLPLDLYANGLYQEQGPYQETVVGGGIILHISTKRAREVDLHLGVATRLDDALIPMMAITYDGWKGGFAYDINTSPFDEATGGEGGPEFFLTYTYKKLWPLKQTKVCSIF